MKKGNITGIVDDSGTNVTIDFDGCTVRDMMNLYSHITARVLNALFKVDKNENGEEAMLGVLGKAVSVGVEAYFTCEEKYKESETLS